MTGSGETREAVPLTARAIEALKPEGAPYRVPDERCRGLAMRVAPSGVKDLGSGLPHSRDGQDAAAVAWANHRHQPRTGA